MKCPGQDMQYWTEGAIFDVKCPECGALVEFYKDDTTRKCQQCQHRFVNPKMDFGCATYCQFAEQCLGTLPEEFVMQQDNLLKDKVAVAMKRYFKADFKSISHATRVARHAENIGKASEGANIALILCSAYLHNIGKQKADEKYGEVTSHHLQQEGPAVAKEILKELGADEQLTEDVCNIISHQTPPEDKALSYFIVYDAYRLATLEDKHKETPLTIEEINSCLSKDFESENGRLHAEKALHVLCNSDS